MPHETVDDWDMVAARATVPAALSGYGRDG